MGHRQHVIGGGSAEQIERRTDPPGTMRRWRMARTAPRALYRRGNVHRRCSTDIGGAPTEGFDIHFLQVCGDRRVLGHQERAAHRKPGIVVRFRNTGFLRQLQRAAAGADGLCWRPIVCASPLCTFLIVTCGVVGITFEIRYLRGGLQGEVVIFFRLPISWRVISPPVRHHFPLARQVAQPLCWIT